MGKRTVNNGTVLEQVEAAALQAIAERDELEETLRSIEQEYRDAIDSYTKAIQATHERLDKSTALASALGALFEREDIR